MIKKPNYLKLSADNPSLQAAFLVITALFAFVVNLGVFEVDIMEARNFIAAREMLDNGKWLLPTMNGLPRLEKPPFPTWFSAIALEYFGESEFWLRLPAAIMALLTTLFTYRFSMLLYSDKNKAFASTIIFISIPMVLIMGRTGSWDIFCTAFSLMGAYYLFKLLKAPDVNPWINTILAAIFIGFSSMSKGPVGIYAMLLPFLIAYFISFKPIRLRSNLKYWLVFLGIMLLIASWWYIYARIEAPNASTVIAEKEVEAWANRHTQPFYFYFPLPVFTGVWAVLIIYSFLFKRHTQEGKKEKEYIFLFLWVVSAIFLLSLIPEKKERYLLPVFPPLAILAGSTMLNLLKKIKEEKLKTNKLESVFWKIFNYLFLTAILLAPIASLLVFQKGGHMSYSSWVLFTAITSILAFWALRNTQKKRHFQQLYVIGLVLILISIGIVPALPSFRYKNEQFKDIREIRENDWYEEARMISNLEINPKAIWRIGKPVRLLKEGEKIKEDNFVLISENIPSASLDAETLSNFESSFIGEYDYFRKKSKFNLHVYRFERKK